MTTDLERVEPAVVAGAPHAANAGQSVTSLEDRYKPTNVPLELAVTRTSHGTHFLVWEKVVAWLVMLLGTVGLFGIAYAAGTDWRQVYDLVKSGAVSIFAFALPLMYFAAAVLLVARRKWALPLFVAHLPLAVIYLASRTGIESFSLVWWFGYFCEALVICMCFRLWARGALR
ncbi:hypothetical protein [Ramlibacter sp. WS9]|uniref:hypothetical protein n=1 Tax=Ramlibacter sp. WS9 TaxID=1882741 RepID=UPI0011417119|nr:hypothetical protein [Ramlibacter sp. WS9]ROZ61530.1 hypothetical protein EEB15_32535 [Ramlibacter sp. WS9]